MRHDKSLPVPVQHVLTASRAKLQAAARLTRFQQQMYFRVMPERFIMAHSLHGIHYRFLVDDTSLIKRNILAESLPDLVPQNLDLHLTHQLDLNLRRLFFPCDVKLRLLLFKLT